jgi:Lipopolysaccharide-assembly
VRRPVLAALLLAGLGAAGCGYSTGLRMPEVQGSPTRSLAIEFFENRTPEKDLERDLQQALSRAAIDLVDAPLVSPDRADLVLRGTVVRFQRRSGIRSSDNQLLESGIRIEIRGTLWRRRRPGEPPPPKPAEQRRSGGASLEYDHRRGLTYERDFSEQPSLGSSYDPDWIQLGATRSVPVSVGYVIGEAGAEGQARARALQNAAERLVLDLFGSMN